MAPLFGKRHPDDTQETLRALSERLARAKAERAQLEALLERLTHAAQALPNVTAPLEAASDRAERLSGRLGELEGRMGALSDVAARLDQLSGQADLADRRRTEAGAQAERLERRLAEVQNTLENIQRSLDTAHKFRTEFDALSGPQGPIAEFRAGADRLHQEFVGYNADVAKVREDQAALRRTQEDAMARFQELRTQASRFSDQLADAQTRLSRSEGTLAELGKVQQVAGRIQEDLASLNALSDHVTQKVSALVKQREVVDRAAAQAARVDELVWDLDAKIKRAEQEDKQLRKTQEGLADLEVLQRQVGDRIAQMKQEYRDVHEAGLALTQRLGDLQGDVQEGLARFAVERQTLDAAGQQIVDLRDTLVEFERRVQLMQGTAQAVAQAQGRMDDIAARLATVSSEVTRVEERAEGLRATRRTLEETETAATRLAERLAALEAAQPGVQELGREVAALRFAREEVRGALEQLRDVRAEIERGHGTQTAVRAWLASVEQTVTQVRERVAGVEQLAGVVEQVRQDAQRALATNRDVTASRQFVEDLERRLQTLGTVSAGVDERMQVLEARRTELGDLEARTASLKERLDDADRRFITVARRAGEVDGVDRRLSEVTATAQQAAEKVNAVALTADAVSSRAAELDALGERVERLARELEQRERTLNAASEHLARASTLRQQVAEQVQDLDERVTKLTGVLATAESRAGSIGEFADQLEARAGTLRFAEKRLAQFEEKMAQLAGDERELEAAIHGVEARRASVDAVRAELGSMFDTAAKAVEDVRAVTAARQEVEAARARFEDVVNRAQQADALAEQIQERMTAIADAERRMGRIDALMAHVRSSLETLNGQKVIVDHMLEKTGQLTFQVKEAEALLEALRDERDIATRLRDGLVELREERKRA